MKSVEIGGMSITSNQIQIQIPGIKEKGNFISNKIIRYYKIVLYMITVLLHARESTVTLEEEQMKC